MPSFRAATGRALAALVGDPALEVGAQEAHVPADTDAGEPAAAHRVVDPRDADGEEHCRLVWGEQRLVQVRAWRAWVEFELTMQEELRSHGVASTCRRVGSADPRPTRCGGARAPDWSVPATVVVHHCESVDQSPVAAVADLNTMTALWAPVQKLAESCRNPLESPI